MECTGNLWIHQIWGSARSGSLNTGRGSPAPSCLASDQFRSKNLNENIRFCSLFLSFLIFPLSLSLLGFISHKLPPNSRWYGCWKPPICNLPSEGNISFLYIHIVISRKNIIGPVWVQEICGAKGIRILLLLNTCSGANPGGEGWELWLTVPPPSKRMMINL